MEFKIYLAHLLSVFAFGLFLIGKIFVSLFGIKNPAFQDKIRRKVKYLDWFIFFIVLVSGIFLLISTKYFQLYHILKLCGLAGLIYFLRYFHRTVYVQCLLLGGCVFALIVTVTISKPKWETNGVAIQAEGKPGEKSISHLEKGQLVFKTICAECHGIDGKLGKFGAIDLAKSNLSLAEKKEVVTNGRVLTVMRSFKDELSTSDIDAVVNYVDSLN